MQDPLKRRVVLMEHIVGGGDIWENVFYKKIYRAHMT